MQKSPRDHVADGLFEPMFEGVGPFQELSERLGVDRALVQGAGGNTSIKHDGVLWVKASGTWLARARDEAIFVPVDLPEIRKHVRLGSADPVTPALRLEAVLEGRRASIETTLHALMSQDVVLHVHSVAVIALAVREDAERLFHALLDGLSWAFVPYARPGLPLTRAVIDAVSDSVPDILILANHGIVVAGPDGASAEQLLMEVERRVSAKQRPGNPVDLERLQAMCRGTGFRLPADESCHVIATESRNLAIAAGGSLYPDHVVFLGAGMTVIDPAESLSHLSGHATPPAFVAVRGVGMVVRDDLPAAAEVMVGCLADVVQLIPDGAEVTYLSEAEENELLNWDAEKLRQAMNRGG